MTKVDWMIEGVIVSQYIFLIMEQLKKIYIGFLIKSEVFFWYAFRIRLCVINPIKNPLYAHDWMSDNGSS